MKASERIPSVDVFRVVAVFFVICIHTEPFHSQSPVFGSELSTGTFINQFARFAVPLFFVLSGYFWAPKSASPDTLFRSTLVSIKRIFFILVVWSLIYLLPMDAAVISLGPIGIAKGIYWNLSTAARHPLTTMFQGTKQHLWFLVALMFCMLISAFFLVRNRSTSLFLIAIIFYTIGLLGGPYAWAFPGFHTEFNFRNGPFFGLIFFVTGYFLHKLKPDTSWTYIGIVVFLIGMSSQFIEVWLLNKYSGISMLQDYVISTYFAGVGIALIALSGASYLNLKGVKTVGPLVLGIYAIHLVFVDLLKPVATFFAVSPIWEAGYPLLVFCLSALSVYVLSRFKFTRAIVS